MDQVLRNELSLTEYFVPCTISMSYAYDGSCNWLLEYKTCLSSCIAIECSYDWIQVHLRIHVDKYAGS